MGFELFDSGPRRSKYHAPGTVPFVTVTNSANLLVNRQASEDMGVPSRVLLYFDRERRAAGIRPAGEDDYRSYRAIPRTNGMQVTIGCVAFVREFKIADGRFPGEMEDGMLVFAVGSPGLRFLGG